MNDKQREVMQMALEALEVLLTCKHGEFCDHYRDAERQSNKAITVLREALRNASERMAQPQGEWVDLTPHEVTEQIREGAADGGWQGFAQRIVTKFKEKNTPVQREQQERIAILEQDNANCRKAVSDLMDELHKREQQEPGVESLLKAIQHLREGIEAMRIETLEKAAQLLEAGELSHGECAAAIRSMK